MLLSTRYVDYEIFERINQQVNKNIVLDYIMIFFAEYAQYILIIAFLFFWIFNKQKSRIVIFQTMLACSLGFTLNRIIGLFFYRDRPFVSHLHINQLVEHAANSSFPSDHATSAFIIAVTVWLYYNRLGFILLVSAVLIALSRIWVGVHFPFDVLAGAIFGSVVAVSIHYLCKTKFIKKLFQLSILQTK
ncbi:undecaprenyl-diphosphatase [Bacillus sp. C1]